MTRRNRDVRTGTVLLLVRGLLATAVLVPSSSPGSARRADAANAEGTFANTFRPGAIGAPGRHQPGPRPESTVPDPIQPVEIRGPDGIMLSVETGDGWTPWRAGPLRIGLVVGRAYRLRVGGIDGREGEELFPSLRILARLAAPAGMAWRFPVEVVIDRDDLDVAADGGHVRRIVYASCETEQPDLVPGGWFDVKPGDDALAVAGTLGDPVAELVLGNRLPSPAGQP